MKVGSSLITAAPEISLLGIEYDSNFTTQPYLQKLAREASTRSSLIYRLSFSTPPHLLSTLANGMLMGKVLSSAAAAMPIKIREDDKTYLFVEDINKAIKATAWTITKTKLVDKVRSCVVLQRAGLRCLNEMVASIMARMIWKSRHAMDPLGRLLFREKCPIKFTRSYYSDDATRPVPGYPLIAANIMARIWNTVPGLKSATSLGIASSISQNWAKSIPTE